MVGIGIATQSWILKGSKEVNVLFNDAEQDVAPW